ncbi:GmrSD restriction endonuclease domain-containing protein [Prauserella alba]|uniref:GmrSD restriction endonucleases N-terminal domain-containing protein n=1 Tax=Prauserella alba TaxID=176898 RepID=A0ABN1V1I1_9PSEU|nr:DUF262 domain-containing protein [Prauserella alba]MCP2178878.1 Protein of unknown function DUF262 [Prauserella alba]
MAKLRMIIDQVEAGTMLLPEFQRGYVWNRDQVRGLMRSLYRGHPVGGLLLWETAAEDVSVRGSMAGTGTHLLLLDGQQRITSLYGIIQGEPPRFFEGNPDAFTGLYFNVADEQFKFYAPSIMADDHRWIEVTRLFQQDISAFVSGFSEKEPENLPTYVERLTRLRNLLERDFHEEKITGKNVSTDEVVDIFNRVNSGGTKLTKGDLALAKLCSDWPDARTVMRDHLAKWESAGFNFNLDWLLRNATSVATSRAEFSSLDAVSAATFRQSLTSSTDYIGHCLDVVSSRLGLDHDRVLMGRMAFPVISRLLALNGGQFSSSEEQGKALYWYVHSALWGRFAGSTETYLNHDFDTAQREGVDGLIRSLERWRGGNLDVQPHDFGGSTTGSRFYPLLYLLTRVNGARDLGTGLELKAEMLGRLSSLQVHHIFPKALLYEAGYPRSLVNSIANFCFLTQNSNLAVGKRNPAEYFPEAESKHPGVLASQWIPQDTELWHVDRYEDFLEARKELLAGAAQGFLSQLREGTSQHAGQRLQPLAVSTGDETDARDAQVRDMIEEMVRLGCVKPITDTEIADPESGRALAMAEAYWPEGLQPGQGEPVILELDAEAADLPRLEELGYEVFTSVDALLGFVQRRSDSAAGVESDDGAAEEPDGSITESESATEFGAEMLELHERSRTEANYAATYFRSMLSELGPLETARKLLGSPAVSDGFAALWERGRLDLTVEALVTQPQFEELFTEQEINAARKRLDQFGYPVPGGAVS